jgi:hypothetical protein
VRPVGFIGMDLVAIELLARQLDGNSDRVESFQRELTAALSATAWSGPDQAAFVEQWGVEFAPALRRSGDLLREAAKVARCRVEAQRRVSGAS